MKVLSWNLYNKNNSTILLQVLTEHNIDVAVLTEYSKTPFGYSFGDYKVYKGNGGCEKVIFLLRSDIDVMYSVEDTRYNVLYLRFEKDYYIIVGIHLQSNIPINGQKRREITILRLIESIEKVEKNKACVKTIIMGDFNCSPFDSEMVSKNMFNAVLFKSLMNKETVRCENKQYKRFYNPMLNIISEEQKNYGTHYCGSGVDTLYWYMYDQVLVRKSLLENLENIQIIKSVGNSDLLTSKGLINKNYSDHLPLLVEVTENGK